MKEGFPSGLGVVRGWGSCQRSASVTSLWCLAVRLGAALGQEAKSVGFQSSLGLALFHVFLKAICAFVCLCVCVLCVCVCALILTYTPFHCQHMMTENKMGENHGSTHNIYNRGIACRHTVHAQTGMPRTDTHTLRHLQTQSVRIQMRSSL